MSGGLYLHIPFCRGSKCPYCDFYSLPFDDSLAEAYVAALLWAMEHQPFYLSGLDSVYFGGGTPSLLGAKRLTLLLERAAACFGLARSCEITLEANPESADADLLKSLRKSGFNRVSFGVQSGVDGELASLGRPHTAARAQKAVLEAHKAGFAHISADLMLGIPGQTPKSLEESAALLTALPLDHISAYLLKIEEGTEFGRRRNTLALPEEDLEAELYTSCVRLLAEAGLARYELSNFARPGGQCRHNLNYWRCGRYLGLGPAAHSFLSREPGPASQRRYSFPRDLEGFIRAANPWTLLRDEGEGGDSAERLMLALRLEPGFDAATLENAAARGALLCKAKELSTLGLCRVEGEIITLTDRGFLLSNPITVALLEVLEANGNIP